MPLILDYEGTCDVYNRCAEKQLTLPRFGYTDQHQILGLLLGAARFARDHVIEHLPFGIFTTIGHYVYQQVPRYLLSEHVLPSDGGDPEVDHPCVPRQGKGGLFSLEAGKSG